MTKHTRNIILKEVGSPSRIKKASAASHLAWLATLMTVLSLVVASLFSATVSPGAEAGVDARVDCFVEEAHSGESPAPEEGGEELEDEQERELVLLAASVPRSWPGHSPMLSPGRLLLPRFSKPHEIEKPPRA